MAVTASRIHVRCFLDGMEIPVLSVQCSFQDGAKASAQVEIVPTDALWDIPPRVCVTIFYAHTEATGVTENDIDDFVSGAVPLGDPRQYKLMFIGEMVSISLNKTPQGRNASMYCEDPSNYFDAIKAHGINAYPGGGIEQIENAFMGVNWDKTPHTQGKSTRRDMKTNVSTWVTSEKVGDKVSITKGVQRMMREMFFVGNVFWARAFNRMRIGDMIVGMKDDLTSANLFSANKFKTFIEDNVASGGEQVSARALVDLINSSTLQTYTTIPCPMFSLNGGKAKHDDEVVGWKPDEKDSLNKLYITRKEYPDSTLNYILLKPDSWFLPPPACNLIFPHQYASFEMGRGYTNEPSRLLMRTEALMKVKATIVSPATQSDQVDPATNQVYTVDKPAKWQYTPQAFRLRDRVYAPDIKEFGALKGATSAGKGYKAKLHDVELLHEQFSGPNVAFGFEANMGRYAAKTAHKNKYLSFFTDYLFWKFRYSGRAASVSCSFNPNLVPGFSCVVFDRVITAAEAKAWGTTPVHYVGYVLSVTHTIAAAGTALTRVEMTAVRPHNEDVDFSSRAEGKKTSESKSIEEIVHRFKSSEDDDDQAGFFDPRYSPTKIGPDFYRKILGCDSIIDGYKLAISEVEANEMAAEFPGMASGGATSDLLAALPLGSGTDTTARAVTYLGDVYAKIIRDPSLSANQFVETLTYRPKANFLDIHGDNSAYWWIPTLNGDIRSFAGEDPNNTSWGNYNSSYRVDGELPSFIGTAVDVLSTDIDNDQYTAWKSTTKTTKTTTQVPTTSPEAAAAGGGSVIDVEAGSTPTEPVVETKTETTYSDSIVKYGLLDLLKMRQAMIRKYLNSLEDRGLRG